MGEISSSYRDKLVSYLVEDESSRGGDEAGDHNIKTARSYHESYKVLVCD